MRAIGFGLRAVGGEQRVDRALDFALVEIAQLLGRRGDGVRVLEREFPGELLDRAQVGAIACEAVDAGHRLLVEIGDDLLAVAALERLGAALREGVSLAAQREGDVVVFHRDGLRGEGQEREDRLGHLHEG